MKLKIKSLRVYKIAIFTVIIVVVALSAVIISTSANASEKDTYAEHVPGEVLVCVQTGLHNSKANLSENAVSQANDEMNNFLSSYDCQTLLCIADNENTHNQLSNDGSFITIYNHLDEAETPVQMRYIKISFNEANKSLTQMINELQSNPLVKHAEPNYVSYADDIEQINIAEQIDTTEQDNTEAEVSDSGQGDVAKNSNAISNVGSNAESSNAESSVYGNTENHNDVSTDYSNLQYAYKSSTGGMYVGGWNDKNQPNVPTESQPTVVAVVDTGVDYNHPDLRIANEDYGDLGAKIGLGGEYGYNASVANVQSEEAKNPMDIAVSGNGHGTHVAGSIGAKWNDDGVSGGGYPLSLLPVKCADNNGLFSHDYVVRAFGYIALAVQKGVNVKVANNSWCGMSADSWFISDMATLVGKEGVVSTWSSGNDHKNTDLVTYSTDSLCNNPYAVVVNSTDTNGNLSNFSNWGVETTDVCAPGDNIFSTAPSWTNDQADDIMVADTRLLNDSDKNIADDFEGGNLKFEYYYDKDCAPSHTLSSVAGKGYGNTKALSLPSNEVLSCDIYVRGNFKNYIEQGYKYFSLLYNAETYNDDNVNFVQCAVLVDDVKVRDTNISSTTTNYGVVSIPTSKIKYDSDGIGVVRLNFCYIDKNFEQQNQTFYVDNVAFTKKALAYRYMSGTSMASPGCCGVTAVVAAQLPNESAKKIAARIKGGTFHQNVLVDKCYSGGIVNLKRSTSSSPDVDLDPVVVSAEFDEASMLSRGYNSTNNNAIVKLKGYFLGDSSSEVYINDNKATGVVKSTDGDMDVLTCTFSANISGSAKIKVNKSGKSLIKYLYIGDPQNLLQRLPMPDKSDSQFDKLYSSLASYVCYASENYLLMCSISETNSFSYFQYDFNSKTWTPTNITDNIISLSKEQGAANPNGVSIVGGDDENLVFYASTTDSTTGMQVIEGLGIVNLNTDEIKYIKINENNTGSGNLFIYEQNKFYYALTNGDITKLYCFNLDSKDSSVVSENIKVGSSSTPYKISDGEYLLIDRNGSDLVMQYKFCADMYKLKIDSEQNGATCEKLEQTAYPTSIPSSSISKAVGCALDGDNLIMSGAANYDSNTHSVVSDTYTRDLSTKQETVMSGILSTKIPSIVTSAYNGYNIYTSFTNGDGINIAVRNLHSPTPGPDPTPPGNGSIPTQTAATGDPIGQWIWGIVSNW